LECIDYVNASINAVDAVLKGFRMGEFKKYKHNPPHLFIPDKIFYNIFYL
jgi:hypothetical protein